MDDNRVKTGADLLTHWRRDWDQLLDLLATVTPAQMTAARDGQEWTGKDHLWHLSAWLRATALLLRGRPRPETLGVPAALWLRGDFAQMNELIIAQGRQRSWPGVLADLQQAARELESGLAELAPAALQQPAVNLDPMEGERPLIDLIYANSAHHLREHARTIALLTAPSLPPPLLQTARLQLRRLAAADALFMLQLLNEPSWLRFIGDRGVRTLAQARAYIAAGPQASYAQHGFGFYLVSTREGRTPMGICGLAKREFLTDPDIGFAFLPDFWGCGFALEAARAVVEYARTELQLRRLGAIVDPQNEASIRLLGKLGLQPVDTVTYPGDDYELQLFTLTLE